jgi:hypothetical protein
MFGSLQSFGGSNGIRRALPGLAALLLAAHAAWAQQSAADDYYAALDRALETVRAADKYSKPTEQQTSELDALKGRLSRDLQARLRRIVGPIAAPPGFTGQGEWAGLVWGGLGTSRLDGIRFGALKVGTAVVTSHALLRGWLAKHVPYQPAWRDDPDGAFARGDLNAAIILSEAQFRPFAFLPVDKPAGVDALTALVGETASDFLIWPPTEISLYLRKGERVYVADLQLATRFTPIAACDPGNYLVQSDDGSYWKGGEGSEEALARNNKCWAERGKDHPGMAAATRQAQAFVDDLARRTAE